MLVKGFEQQVRNTPHKLAIKAGEKSVSYDELNRSANRIAGVLSRAWPKDSSRSHTVGLLLDHGIDMIAALFGVLKAGKIYVPLSPDYPLQRLFFITSHADVSFILTDVENIETANKVGAENNIPVINLGEIDASVPGENHAREVHGNKPAYILYTSGSTGVPKGVVQTHKNVMYFIQRYTENLSITGDDRMTLLSSFSHDAAVMDIYGALLKGSTLYPLDIRKEASVSWLTMVQWLNQERITIWHSVPTVYRCFVSTIKENETPPLLRLIVLGGEEVLMHDIEMCRKLFPHTTLCNLYGQTESSYNAAQFITPGTVPDEITLGQEVKGTELVVADEEGREVIALEIGEIVVVSPYVSPGYWKDNIPPGNGETEKFYWTGDLGRLLMDGSIKFVGRKDFQVKIRGYRVELGEIENQLLKHPEIKEAAVTAREDEEGDKYLCAYIVPHSNPRETGGVGPGFNRDVSMELRDYLSAVLPDYMVPLYFQQLDRMPLTSTGKVDRRALPAPAPMAAAVDYMAPRNPLEEKLVEIWKEILRPPTGTLPHSIGIDDNFFQLGGHSLKVTIMAAEIYRELGAAVGIPELFKFPTIRQIAAIITGSWKRAAAHEPEVETKEYYPLSYNQQRLFILHQLEPASSAFNMPRYIDLEHEVNGAMVEQVFHCLMMRHESLRTAFKSVNHQPYQFVINHLQTPFNTIDISLLPPEQKRQKRDLIYNQIATQPFDLARAPLFRLILVKLEPAYYRLMFNMHHIISDGWSMEILGKEFTRLYERYRTGQEPGLDPLRVRYKDFSQWHCQWLSGQEGKESARYWKQKLAPGVPLLQLPGNSALDKEDRKGAAYRCMIHEDTKADLKKLAQTNQTTMFTVMFSVYLLLLSGITGEPDIACSIIAAGRERPSLHQVIGFFANSVIFKIFIDKNEPFEKFLQRVKEGVTETFQHQAYPLELVFGELGMKYPDIPVTFNLLSIGETAAEKLEPFSSHHIGQIQDVKFDLEPYITEYRNGIDMYWAYKKNMFAPAFIETIAENYIKSLAFFTKHPCGNLNEQGDGLPGGKINRYPLPGPKIETQNKYIAPQNNIQEKLVEIWCRVLRIEAGMIGIDNNFFQLGGHSLKAAIMASMIHEEFDVKLALKEVFNTPTIRGLSRHIMKAAKDKYLHIQPTEIKAYYPLSSAQERFYILQQIDLESTAYNIPRIVKLQGQLEEKRIEAAFKWLIDRHDSLRTSFEMVNNKVVQRVHNEVPFEIEYYDLNRNQVEVKVKVEEERSSILEGTRGLAPLPEESHLSSSDVIRHRNMSSDFIRPFDLSKAPLLRVGLIPLHTPPFGHPSQEGNVENEHILMFDMHHIISDGSSLGIIIEDLLAFYTRKKLPTLRLQYKDFSQWQNRQCTSGKFKKQEQYWLDHFTGELPVLRMPIDYPRPPVQSFAGDSIGFHFEKELTLDLHLLMRESSATLYMILLALYNISLSKCTGQEDIIIGTPTAGRNHLNLENIIGLLIETIAIRNFPEGDKTFAEFLYEVKENTLNAYENQEYPFSELVKQVGNEKEHSRNPLFDAMLIVQNIDPLLEEEELENHELKVVQYEGANKKVSKVDLTLEAAEKQEGIYFKLEYCTALFKRETIDRFITIFKEIAASVMENKKIKLKDIKISHDLGTAAAKIYEGAEIEFEL